MLFLWKIRFTQKFTFAGEKTKAEMALGLVAFVFLIFFCNGVSTKLIYMSLQPEIFMSLSLVIEISVFTGWVMSFLIILREGLLKKKRPKWAYGGLVLSLALAWTSALLIILFIFSELSHIHRVLDIVFVVASAILLLIIALGTRKTFQTNRNTTKELALFFSFAAFTAFVSLSYLWFP
jgi:hypothetical protein